MIKTKEIKELVIGSVVEYNGLEATVKDVSLEYNTVQLSTYTDDDLIWVGVRSLG
jgi:hypothetical protein